VPSSAAPNDFSFSNISIDKVETLAVSTLFQTKKNLDFVAHPLVDLEGKCNQVSSSLISVTQPSIELNNRYFAKSLTLTESVFIIPDFNTKFNKNSFTDSSIKKLNSNPFVSSILENSIESSLSIANANR
jgi:hypothetical protein